MRRTKEEAGATRTAILDAAERLFLERGLAAVTLNDVAKAAGFTRGAVHWHFQNKLGLLIAIHDRVVLPMQDLVEKLSIDKEVDPLRGLINTTTRVFVEIESDPVRSGLLRLLSNAAWDDAMAPLCERQRQFYHRSRSLIGVIFTSADARDGLAFPWHPTTAALAFHALVSGLVNEWLQGDCGFTLSMDASEAVRNFVASLVRT